MMIMIILLKLLSENLQASPEKINSPLYKFKKYRSPLVCQNAKFSLPPPPSAERGEDTVELS